MKIRSHLKSIVFHLHSTEVMWLLNAFENLQESYAAPMDSLSEVERAYWKGTIASSPQSEIHLKSEAESLENERLEWKSLRLEKTSEWLKQFLDHPIDRDLEFHLLKEEIDLFFQITNDRRLLLAHLHEVKEEDMHHRLESLDESGKSMALIEIDFLAFLQSALLQQFIDRPES